MTLHQAEIDFERLWGEVTSQFRGDPASIHGPRHWKRVEENGLRIASRNGANVSVVRLFAVLHDSCRHDDRFESSHGQRAAEYAADLRGALFHIDDTGFAKLCYACKWHTHGQLSEDATIGACWDADRLDLVRIGIRPDPRFLSTQAAREIAASI